MPDALQTSSAEGEPEPTWKRVSGCLGLMSGAGAWASLGAALLSWGIALVGALVCVAIGATFAEIMETSPGGAQNFIEGLFTVIFMIIVFIVMLAVQMVAIAAFVLLPMLVAVVVHAVGLVASFGTIVAPGARWQARLAGVPPLFIHGTVVAGALVLAGLLAVQVYLEQAANGAPPPVPMGP